MSEEQPKILIGCPTYAGHDGCIERFIQGLKNLSYQNADVIFASDSTDVNFLKKIQSAGYSILKNPLVTGKMESIVQNRNKIIQHVSEKKYDYLFFVDTDVLLPEDAIEKLLSVNQAIASGIYLGAIPMQGTVKIAPIIYDFGDKEDYVKAVPMNHVMKDWVFEIAACGFGCCLIKREVLEKVKLRYNKETQAGEDTCFCFDARKQHKYHIFANTGVKCIHMGKNKEADFDFPAGIAGFNFEQEVY